LTPSFPPVILPADNPAGGPEDPATFLKKEGDVTDWYYVSGGGRAGPVDDAEFQALVDKGEITPDSFVWRYGMPDWQPYSQVAGPVSGGAQPAAPGEPATARPSGQERFFCTVCGRQYPADELIDYSGHKVCAQCKPVFFQRLREGIPLHSTFIYGGFWIRAVAKIIDNIIMSVANMIIQLPFQFLGMITMMDTEPGQMPGASFWLWWSLMMLLQIMIPAAYTTFFLGRFGATPGKMALGMKVVTSDGGPVTYLRGFARYFAEMLSVITFGIGYIMAGFDEEKRTLHDRVCDTRVIRIR